MNIITKKPLDIKESISPCEVMALDNLVNGIAREGNVFVEIGTWKGHSASIIANVLKGKGGCLYCIDHWKGNEGTENIDLIDGDNIYRIFEHNMKCLGLWDTITPMKLDSITASERFLDRSVDFLFLDADHRYIPFTKDLHTWFPKIKKGGVICGHDCEQFYSNLTEAQKTMINHCLDIDFIESYKLKCHPGVIRGLYDCLGDDYGILANTNIWFMRIE